MRRTDARPPRGDARHDRRQRAWRRPRVPFPPIVGGFLLVGALATGAMTWLLVSRLHAGALIAYLAGVNFTTLGAYAYDKFVARRSIRLWRVPEAALHLLALAGGTPAAFAGRHLLRHKTRKPGFQTWFRVIMAAQAAAVAG